MITKLEIDELANQYETVDFIKDDPIQFPHRYSQNKKDCEISGFVSSLLAYGNRKVFIENIELNSFDEESQQAQVLIKCSKGTYIRSIANDLGEKLGCGGYLVKLIRTQAGNFRVENSIQLDGIDVENNLLNPLDVMDLPKISVNDEDLARIKNGMPILKKCDKIGNFVILVYNDVEICAVGIADGDKIKLKKVFL